MSTKPVSSERVRPFLLVDNFHFVPSAAAPASTTCHSTPLLMLVVSLVTSTLAAGALPCVAIFNLDSLLAQAVSVPLILKESDEPLCPRDLSLLLTRSSVGAVPPRKAWNVCQLPSLSLTSTFSASAFKSTSVLPFLPLVAKR